MFVKPATEAATAGHQVKWWNHMVLYTVDSGLCVQLCPVQNWIFIRFWGWAQTSEVPPSFRSSSSCHSSQEQTVPAWLSYM